MPPRKILFVDDEPTLRITLPTILKQHGYVVSTAGTVREALTQIHAAEFNVLITDLHIGQPGDGFTVVSAMRRSQPDCLNIILTGYPAFEAALEAIRQQMDDFLVKPADPEVLVNAIEQKINRGRNPDSAPVPMPDFLRQNGSEIIRRMLGAMKAHKTIGALSLTDSERTDHLPAVFTRLASLLEYADSDDHGRQECLEDAAQHGKVRKRQRYSPDMLVEDRRLLGNAIHEVVQEHLLNLNLSRVIPDLQRINDSLDRQLGAALRAYGENGEKHSGLLCR